MRQLIDPDGRFARVIEPTITGMGYNLVRVRQTSVKKGTPTLQVMLERANGSAVNVSDCTKVSRALSALLDVEDPFDSAYDLEISSTGVPRPLTRLEDFKAYVGRDVKLEIFPPVNNRKRFRGILTEILDDSLTVKDNDDDTIYELAFTQLSVATPVFTDDLLEFEASRGALPSGDDNAEADDTETELTSTAS